MLYLASFAFMFPSIRCALSYLGTNLNLGRFLKKFYYKRGFAAQCVGRYLLVHDAKSVE